MTTPTELIFPVQQERVIDSLLNRVETEPRIMMFGPGIQINFIDAFRIPIDSKFFTKFASWTKVKKYEFCRINQRTTRRHKKQYDK